MFRRLRETGPVVLVPLAWTFAVAAHRGLLSLRTVLIAHLVMDTIIVAFTLASWREMTEGVLLAWKGVLVGGLAITLAGTAALAVRPVVEPVLAGTVLGWLVLPAAGLAYTGREVERLPWAYDLGATLSVVGAVGYVAGLAGSAGLVTPALAVAGLGQTAGIVAAVVAY